MVLIFEIFICAQVIQQVARRQAAIIYGVLGYGTNPLRLPTQTSYRRALMPIFLYS